MPLDGLMVNVYISKQRQAAIEASGKSIIELIDLGLASVGEPAAEVTHERDISKMRTRGCPHPPARRAKGLCMACGTYVG